LAVLFAMAFLGGRLHYLFLEEGYPFGTLWEDFPAVYSGWGYRLPGGLLLGLVSAPIVAALMRLPFRTLADSAAPLMPVGLAIGRVGCFIFGCCFGYPSDLPWAISFPADSEVYWNHVHRGLIAHGASTSLPVHPLPLYMITAECTIAAALFWLRRRRLYVGEVGVAWVVLQSWSMAALEIFRETELVTPVPLRQAAPVVTGIIAIVALVALRVRALYAARPDRAHGAVGAPAS
jgi:phosphatidylglycerol:prolipoprotein diacylglycerol transferase